MHLAEARRTNSRAQGLQKDPCWLPGALQKEIKNEVRNWNDVWFILEVILAPKMVQPPKNEPNKIRKKDTNKDGPGGLWDPPMTSQPLR